MHKFIVDLGSFSSGRTICLEARNPKQAYSMAQKQLNERACEKIVQIRDEQNKFYYDCEFGFHGNWR